MSEIICPECNKIISSLAKACPNCGFPMSDFLKEHELNDLTKIWVCTKCGECYYSENRKQPICEYCNIPLIQTNIDNNEYSELDGEEYYKKTIEIAKIYGNDFSEEGYNYRRIKIRERINRFLSTTQPKSSPQPSTQVTCPYCKSTNVKKISGAGKAASIIGFGLFSKKIGKQWYCNNCKSYF